MVDIERPNTDELLIEIEKISETINKIADLLEKEKKATRKKVNKNPIYIDPGIIVEFKKKQKKPLNLTSIISLYSDWTNRTYKLCKYNAGRLKKGKIRKHTEDCFAIVKTITLLRPPGKPQ